jgi:hypothetical protein
MLAKRCWPNDIGRSILVDRSWRCLWRVRATAGKDYLAFPPVRPAGPAPPAERVERDDAAALPAVPMVMGLYLGADK